MIGLSRTLRASSTRALACQPRTGIAVALSVAGVAFALSTGCESALSDGNPTGTNPFGPGNSSANNPGGSGGTNSTNLPGIAAPGEARNPSLSTLSNSGPTVDANGAPLPAEMLMPLEQCDTPGPRQVRRLTSRQYRNSLVAVFGDQMVPDAPVLNDPSTLGYGVDADDSLVQDLGADALMGLAESIATWARTNGKINGFANGCNQNQQNCQDGFIRSFGEKVTREPLSQPQVDRYRALFSAEGVGDAFEDGAEAVMAAMLQSPYILYRRELGPSNRTSEQYQLTPFEVASELSYFLTNSPPDSTLMEAAKSGQVDVDAQAARLLGTAGATQVMGQFVRSWVDVDRLLIKAKEGANLTPELKDAMLAETAAFFNDVLSRPDGTIGDLFSADYTFMNKPLADFYGVPGGSGDAMERVDISDGRRVPGLIGQGSYLTAHALADNSSPVQRAFVVRERFLCNDLPEVPTNLDTNLKPQVAGSTSRERYALHSSQEPCHSCHKLMDPIGFTFENYDGFGRFREMEANKPVDSKGGVPLMNGRQLANPEVMYPINELGELATYLSEIEDVRACMINNLSYFSYGIANAAKWPNDEKVCTDNFIRQEARNSGNTLKSALMATLHAPHFTTRVRDID
ncbi:MAG: hypothetical protein RL033_2908 [Pseudomonadota bacterium]